MHVFLPGWGKSPPHPKEGFSGLDIRSPRRGGTVYFQILGLTSLPLEGCPFLDVRIFFFQSLLLSAIK